LFGNSGKKGIDEFSTSRPPPHYPLVHHSQVCSGNHPSPLLDSIRPPSKPLESSILDYLAFNPSHQPSYLETSHKNFLVNLPFLAPPQGFYKVNFDGTSKGNPGQAGYGAVIRDNVGQIQYLMAEHLGHDTNNSAKLWGLVRGIQMDFDLNLTHLIIEGDSKVIINLAAKIINGNEPLGSPKHFASSS
jgi:hypothetical protein